MVSTKNKKKNAEITSGDPYKTFRILTFFIGILFLLLGMRFLSSQDPAGALLNGIAGLLFLMASYVFFKKKKDLKLSRD